MGDFVTQLICIEFYSCYIQQPLLIDLFRMMFLVSTGKFLEIGFPKCL